MIPFMFLKLNVKNHLLLFVFEEGFYGGDLGVAFERIESNLKPKID